MKGRRSRRGRRVAFSARRMAAELRVYARSNLRSREGFFFTLIFPIILVLLFGAIFAGGNAGPATVYVQNHDAGFNGMNLGNAFIQALNQTYAESVNSTYTATHNVTAVIRLVGVPLDQNLTQYLSAHSASDGIIIPENFSQAFLEQMPVNVTVYGNPASTTSAEVSGITREFVNEFNTVGASGVHSVGVQSAVAVSSSYKYIDFLIPGLIGFSALTSPMFALVNISSSYRRDKVFKLLSLTPLTKTEWLLSKIVWYIGTTIISFVLMSIVGIYIFGAHIVFNWGIGMFLVIGPFFFVSLGMLVGTISNTPESAAVVGNLVTFPMMFLSGTFFPVQSMPTYLQMIAHVLPLFYLIDGLTNVMIYGNFGPAYVDLGVMLVISVVVFALAVRFFRWRED
jgi:ABC-2 type transport system permease protein